MARKSQNKTPATGAGKLTKWDRMRGKLPLVLVMAAMLWAGFWMIKNAAQFSMTSDEAVYIPSGVRALEKGDIIMNSEHPPLNKLLAGLFVLPLKPDINQALDYEPENDQWRFGDYFFYQSGNSTRALLFWGRLATALMTLGLIYLVYLWTAKNINPWVGAVAALSISFNPNIIANGSMTTNDLHLAFAVWILLMASTYLIQKPKALSYVLFGLALALVLLAKFSGVFFAGLAIIIVFAGLLWRKEKLRRVVGWGIVALALCTLTVWSTYLFIERGALFSTQMVHVNVPRKGLVYLDKPAQKIFIVPVLRYKEGYDVVRGHNEIGHNAYLDGEYSMSGFRDFFVKAIWYKTPTAILVICLIGLVWAIKQKQWYIIAPAIIAFIFLGAMSWGRIHIGIRHILPFYVLLAPMAGGGVYILLANKNKLGYIIAAILMIWLVADLSYNSPNKLSFFSQISGGWRQGCQHLSDSNTDWGQELYLLEAWRKAHPAGKLIVGYVTGENPKYLGIDYQNLTDIGAKAACKGLPDDTTAIISVNLVTGLFGPYPCLHKKIGQAERLGHTYLIFRPSTFK